MNTFLHRQVLTGIHLGFCPFLVYVNTLAVDLSLNAELFANDTFLFLSNPQS